MPLFISKKLLTRYGTTCRSSVSMQIYIASINTSMPRLKCSKDNTRECFGATDTLMQGCRLSPLVLRISFGRVMSVVLEDLERKLAKVSKILQILPTCG